MAGNDGRLSRLIVAGQLNIFRWMGEKGFYPLKPPEFCRFLQLFLKKRIFFMNLATLPPPSKLVCIRLWPNRAEQGGKKGWYTYTQSGRVRQSQTWGQGVLSNTCGKINRTGHWGLVGTSTFNGYIMGYFWAKFPPISSLKHALL